jgi:tetratricopeptide (TPR) repeat protein
MNANRAIAAHEHFSAWRSYGAGGNIVRAAFLLVWFLLADIAWCAQTRNLSSESKWHSPAHLLAGQDSAFQRGLIALKDDLPQAALDDLTTAEEEQPADARVRSFRGIALARLGRNPEAAAEYREAIRLNPAMEEAYRNIGFLEWKEQHFEQARDYLQRAVTLSSKDSFAHYYLGRVQLDLHQYDVALRELNSSGMPWPAEPEFLIEVATGYRELGRQHEVRQVLDRVIPLSLTATQSVRLASLLLSMHDNDKAIQVLRRLTVPGGRNDPSWLRFDLALADVLGGNYQDAADQARLCTDKSVAVGSDIAADAPAWSLIGIADARMAKIDDSISALRRAALLAPATEEYWLNLTRELMALDRYEDAITFTKQGIAANPRSYALHLRLGAANLAASHYPEAEKSFRELVIAGDPLPTSYVGLAQVLMRTGRADEAASELENARQRLGPNFLISYFRGLALSRTANPSEAVAAFQEALQANPDSAEAHLGLGKTELSLGNASAAVIQLEETLRLSPDNQQARHLLMQARRRTGDKHYAELAVDAQPASQADLLSDFVLPEWQIPMEQKPN